MNHIVVVDASVAFKVVIVLAEMLEAKLWTDDRRLINSVGEATPWVRWIGDYTAT